MPGYDDFIDAMVNLAGESAFVARLRMQGHAERPNWREIALDPAEDARRAFVASLTNDQREMLASLLLEERKGAVHDVLAWLEWARECVGLTLRDRKDDYAKTSRETFHGDFIAAQVDRGAHD